jgi:hypothetical protein
VSEEEIKAKENAFPISLAASFRVQNLDVTSLPPNISLYWHVISQDSTPGGGNIPDSRIQAQMDVMNQAYAPVGMYFHLAQITRTQNADWFNTFPGDPREVAMKSQLRVGGVADLNVYTVIFNNGLNEIGHSYFPSDLIQGGLIKDGVMVHPETLPGGAIPEANLGKTLVHETGHWLGLYHTFQGGCDDPNGDYVDDTPASASQTEHCPTSRDSCPLKPGNDPFHNYMDYSSDGCMTEFTQGQISRIGSQILQYRGINLNFGCH